MLMERQAGPDRLGDLDEVFEILVTAYGKKGGAVPAEGDLCWRPATDAYETQEAYVVVMDLAGMEPGQIEILTDGESLTVRGTRQETAPGERKHFIKMEIDVGPFVRRIPIPVAVDLQSGVARYRNGFLTVVFTKGRGPSPQRRQIEVE